jgi:hypothetical protein
MASDPYSGAPNPAPENPSGNNKKVILIIALAVLVLGAIPCIGIFAAIAIPAFVQYTRRAKTAEAEVNLMTMANVAQMHVLEKCTLPPELPRHADIAMCANGEKCMPAIDVPPAWVDFRALQGPTYFVYSATLEGDSVMILRAEADFNTSNPELHTHEMRLTMVGECELEQSEAFVINEFD